jgi:hypothetical protein
MNQTITNRRLLRDYKTIKNQLMSGEIQEVLIPQKDGVTLKLSIEQSASPARRMMDFAQKNTKRNFKRPEQDLW